MDKSAKPGDLILFYLPFLSAAQAWQLIQNSKPSVSRRNPFPKKTWANYFFAWDIWFEFYQDKYTGVGNSRFTIYMKKKKKSHAGYDYNTRMNSVSCTHNCEPTVAHPCIANFFLPK